ncbi:ARABIDOPSIS THALIANA GIBBERELLIN 3-OXIDASE 3, gibberellin 3-oxidase 3 [Hibiscus trionum]|nr:ARABIDOPSIS THALIANA GIBBERELLIN 3-OXIDASE 3, gibberellin 3-oxidase 3 [Hibiscus trionum]
MNTQTQTFNHLLPIDFTTVSTVPDSHAWSPTSSPSHLPINDDKPLLPVIDIGKPDAYELVRHACEEWGAFQVINHGVPLSLFSETVFQARRLFSLPMEKKHLVARPPSGTAGYGSHRISAFFPKLMWTEGYRMMGSPVEHARKLWPQDHAKFCEVMEQWQAEMKTLTERIVAMMFGSLGLTNEEEMQWFESQNGCDQPLCVLQLNSYPVCPDPERAMGLAPHTDSSLITLLDQGNISGLQVYKEGEGWVSVEPIEGAVVVNVGDLMQVVSNGRFKSVLHRAVVNKTHHRVSNAFFYGPPWDVKVSPLRKLVDSDHPQLYRSLMWKEYLQIKKNEISGALEAIRL